MAEDNRKEARGVRLTRRALLLGLGSFGAASVVLRPAPARATFGEDVAVLLAQLEQQLQMVSNAIATVQNLVQTVQHLSAVAADTKRFIKRATSKGGLKGIMGDLTNGEGGLQGVINAAANVTGFAQDVVSDLNAVGDLVWDEKWAMWQSQADLCAGKPEHECALAWSDRIRYTSDVLKRSDPTRIRSMKPLKKAFMGLKKMYDAHREAVDAAREAQQEEGVLGAVQMNARVMGNYMTIATKHAEMAGISAQLQADEYGRAATVRELNREQKEAVWKDMEVTEDAPVDTGFEFSRSQWESR